MGSLAAHVLLKKLANEKQPETVKVDPELIVRESTAAARPMPRRGSPES
jgi:DNA-binding LacI/PurR family transcriptional regulator